MIRFALARRTKKRPEERAIDDTVLIAARNRDWVTLYRRGAGAQPWAYGAIGRCQPPGPFQPFDGIAPVDMEAVAKALATMERLQGEGYVRAPLEVGETKDAANGPMADYTHTLALCLYADFQRSLTAAAAAIAAIDPSDPLPALHAMRDFDMGDKMGDLPDALQSGPDADAVMDQIRARERLNAA